MKRFFRCNVCNDIHWGESAPETCPTCQAYKAYAEIDAAEAAKIVGTVAPADKRMTEQEVRLALAKFTEGKEFELNPDSTHVDYIIKGIMANAEAKGLKYCPCRIPVGDFEKDLGLVCPCNFFTHKTWASQGRCWCGLFTRRK